MKNTKVKKMLLIIFCIIINLLGRGIAYNYHMAVWLDSVGTGVAVYFGGLWAGVIAGGISLLVLTLARTALLLHLPVMLLFALLLSYTISKKRLDAFYKVVVTGFWIGSITSVAATIMDLLGANGYCGNSYGDTLTDMLLWKGTNRIIASFLGEAIVEMIDKQITVALLYIVVRIWNWGKTRKKQGAGAVSGLLLLSILLSLLVPPISLEAAWERYDTETYKKTIYSNDNGLMSSTANAIEETADGHIWIGGYDGLKKFDGTSFELLHENGMASICCMLTDREGCIWMGTNDGGLIRYRNGENRFWSVKDGLPVNSVRSIAQGQDGSIYVGTTEQLCRVREDDTIEILAEDIVYAKKMAVYKERVLIVDNQGEIYVYHQGCLENRNPLQKVLFADIQATTEGVIAGTLDGKVLLLDFEGDNLVVKEECAEVSTEISNVYQSRNGIIWVGMKSGLGYIAKDGKFWRVDVDGFDSSYEDIHEDYQGNIWVASSRYGVMKLSHCQFYNLFEKYQMEESVVNAVCVYEGNIYCCTDNGLRILSAISATDRNNQLTDMLQGMRIRDAKVDSRNRLWICTYGEYGLICYKQFEGIVTYTREKDGMTNDRVRCVLETEDGTIVAGTVNGINYIKDGKVVSTITSEDGLLNAQILTLEKGEGGRVYAGTDGAGIYVLENGKIVDHISVDQGLSSDVILRIVETEEGYFVVCSNSLCFMDKEEQVRVLDNFPYFNNYDVIEIGKNLYVPGGAGLYEINKQQLLSGDVGSSRLYHGNQGLNVGLTSNSFNHVTTDGRIYLCSNKGIICFTPWKQGDVEQLKYDLECLVVDGKEITTTGQTQIVLPPETKQIVIKAGVYNYNLSGAKVKFFLEGEEESARLYEWNEINDIQIPVLGTEKYTIHLQLLDNYGEVLLGEKTYVLEREKHAWEESSYITYLWGAGIEILIAAVWSVATYYMSQKKKEDLEKLQVELEQKITEQNEALWREQNKQKSLLVQTVVALSGAVDAKDKYTSGHSKRVAEYSKIIAEKLGKSAEEQEMVYRAGLLHDVGKIRIPEDIINKPGKLTDQEFELIKIHPVTGYSILKKIDGNNGILALGAKFHHERYDGKGYPNGLSGENIPEIARIIGVADAYDAMASNRSYRKALRQEIVREEILKGRGAQFDPKMADIMLELIDQDKDYRLRQQDLLYRTVLAVDDEEMNIKMIAHILKDEPMYNLISVNSAMKALEYLKDNRADVILLDLMMPEMDGFELFKLVREKYDTPVIFMTGDRNLETIRRASELGVEDYITKPFLPLELKEVIHSVLWG